MSLTQSFSASFYRNIFEKKINVLRSFKSIEKVVVKRINILPVESIITLLGQYKNYILNTPYF